MFTCFRRAAITNIYNDGCDRVNDDDVFDDVNIDDNGENDYDDYNNID